jgi:hypothetical protein
MIAAWSLLPLLGVLISYSVWLVTLVVPSQRTREGTFLSLVNLCTAR